MDIADSLVYITGSLNIEDGTILKNNAISVATSDCIPSSQFFNYSSGYGIYATGITQLSLLIVRDFSETKFYN